MDWRVKMLKHSDQLFQLPYDSQVRQHLDVQNLGNKCWPRSESSGGLKYHRSLETSPWRPEVHCKGSSSLEFNSQNLMKCTTRGIMAKLTLSFSFWVSSQLGGHSPRSNHLSIVYVSPHIATSTQDGPRVPEPKVWRNRLFIVLDLTRLSQFATLCRLSKSKYLMMSASDQWVAKLRG